MLQHLSKLSLRRHVLAGLLLVLCSVFSFAQNRVLVFSKTASYRHASIEVGKATFQKLGIEKGFAVDTTEDAAAFTEENLQRYRCVVWLSTTGNVLNPAQQNAFERYIQAGGGYFGIHAAADTEYDWPWYGKLVGGWFDNHPSQPSNIQKGTFHIVDTQNPLTNFLPEPWIRTDEFYAYKKMNPDVKVLITIDEKSYIGGTMGDYHPMAWYHEFDGGRAFYSVMGHTDETFSEPLVLQHFWTGLQWAMGGNPLDYAKVRMPKFPEENRFTKIVLADKLDEPMELAMLPDKKVLFIQRKGEVKLYDPAAGQCRTIATIPVSTKYLPDSTGKSAEAEDGLLGLTIDPDFAKNHWIYLYYSQAGDQAQNILTRYEMRGDELLLDSKKVLLNIPVQRAECCHTGGSMDWDGNGNLFLSTGDNSSPRADGFSPIDERPGRGPWDAQKSSGNTNDLRGKIIRIHPESDGSYSIPAGNLFAKGIAKTRPEIYTMGHRNPFRIAVDKKTGFLYWGEVGPDASKPDAKRGPEGFDEVGQARKAGNFGWPYHIADNKPYIDYNYATKESAAPFSVEKPLNQSPNNTGLTELPPAQKAFIWYPYAESTVFPLVGTGGRNAMAGPVFHRDDFKGAAHAWPAYYDDKLIIYDWMRGWMMAVTMNTAGDYVSMEPIMPSHKFSNPMDMTFAADGDLYMLEYGTGWFQANDDARLVRIEYNPGNRKPAVQIAADKMAGSAPLAVQFSAAGTKDFDGDKLTYDWVITPKKGGKKQVFKTEDPQVTLKKPGVYIAVLTVSDDKGASASENLEIVVGNEPPVLELDLAGSNRTFFFPGQKIKYEVRVHDKEDGSLANGGIDPSQVAVNIDYLPEGFDKIAIAQGHRFSDGNAQYATAQKIMDKTDCKSCHKPAEKSIGPNYHDIAVKYKGQAGAIELLSGHIINGSVGVWGEVQMAAHPSLSAADAAILVKFILSHDDAKTHPAPLPVKGEYTTTIPEDDKGVGVYMLRAAYLDRGAANLPTLSSEKLYVLRNPSMSGHDFEFSKNVQKMTFGGMKLGLPSGNGSYIGFREIDLTGIKQVQVTASAPKQYNFAGGSISLHLDTPDGAMAAEPVRLSPAAPDNMVPDALKIRLFPATQGIHDIYFVFNNDTVGVSQSLFSVIGLVFQDESMTTAKAPPPAPKEITLTSIPAPAGLVWKTPQRQYVSSNFKTEVITNVSQPTLTAYLPDPATANGTAVIVAPGGGFHALSINSEGIDVAKWLVEHGVAAFVLKYRLEPTGEDGVQEFMQKAGNREKMDQELAPVIALAKADGLAAIAYVRTHAAEFGIQPDRIGIMGFSAGGAVAGSAAFEYTTVSRPDFVAPIYPALQVVNTTKVPSDAPPLFIAAASDDFFGFQTHCTKLYDQWMLAKKPAELHLYSKGGHGFGMRQQNLPTDHWIDRFGEWLDTLGLLKK